MIRLNREECDLWDSFSEPQLNFHNCKRKERISYFYDNAKTLEDKKQLEQYSRSCSTCYNYLRRFQEEQEGIRDLLPKVYLQDESLQSLKFEIAESYDRVMKLRKPEMPKEGSRVRRFFSFLGIFTK